MFFTVIVSIEYTALYVLIDKNYVTDVIMTVSFLGGSIYHKMLLMQAYRFYSSQY